MMFCLFHAAKAEITCRSCQPGHKWRAQELLLKFDRSESSAGSTGEVSGRGDGAWGARAASGESRRLRCAAAGSSECAPDRADYAEPRLKRNTRDLRANGGIDESGYAKIKVSYANVGGQQRASDGASPPAAAAARRKARTGRNSAGDGRVGSPGAARSRDPGEGSSSAAARRVARSEMRWSREERRAGGPRQEEPKLNSSTFALTGDSSHNQAMVHWSGQNSSHRLNTRVSASR
ncbi:putative VPS10 domain-containing receptor SorCS1-like [Scophthalmus maximus]|uniref:Putative VPS10 domain-containing receptor SorCS1-like n=1 Tax=Scophthalmus maximus TaxID=52904 RepID=A0A2U9BPY5_SCOMX|nr:putative VPS10 domain-containing receptor SorCS1-like [Scophthalmus maximus]